MARPREFDPDEALDAAIQVFWQHGYEATSLSMLMEAMGLHKGSIYKAFGGKHELFSKALDQYLRHGLARVQTVLQEDRPPLERLEKMMRHALPSSCDSSRGCFGLNTLVELGPHDKASAARVRSHFSHLRRALSACIAQGQDAGSIRTDASAEVLAEFLLTTLNGLQAASKGYLPLDTLHQVADVTLTSLRTPHSHVS